MRRGRLTESHRRRSSSNGRHPAELEGSEDAALVSAHAALARMSGTCEILTENVLWNDVPLVWFLSDRVEEVPGSPSSKDQPKRPSSRRVRAVDVWCRGDPSGEAMLAARSPEPGKHMHLGGAPADFLESWRAIFIDKNEGF